MLLLFILLPFLGAALFYLLPKDRLPAKMAGYLALFITGLCLLTLGWLTFIGPEESRSFLVPWVPQIGLNFSLWLDGPAIFWAWLVSGIGFLVFFYAIHYMDPTDSPWRFYGTMVFFMGAMLGVVISKNVLLMFIFWEMTSISSFILIGHWHEKASAREGAVRALVTTAGGGLCLLAGIAGIFWIAVTQGVDPAVALEWDMIWENSRLFLNHWAVEAILILLLIGAFTKSAQFPFHYWLPGAMEAPTPVSAYLHAATMVKAGIYLMGRLYPTFSNHDLWLILLGGAGVLTMLIGGAMAMVSRDLKQLLAHSTVSQLGLLTAYYGFGKGLVGTEAPLSMDLLLVASHAFFKGGLFMMVGVIDHGCHTREWTRLGGLRKAMPVTTVLVILGCLSMAGAPFTLGFVAKELFLKAAFLIQTDNVLLGTGLPLIAIIASVFTAAYCYRTAISAFFGKPRDKSIHPHEGSAGILIAPTILIGLSILAGLYVPLVERPISALINAPYYGTASGFVIGFFPYVDKLLFIAIFLFGMGFVVFKAGEKILLTYEKQGSPAIFRGAYNLIFNMGVPNLSSLTYNTVQKPSLSRNIAWVTLSIFAGLAVTMYHSGFRLPGVLTAAYFDVIGIVLLVFTVASLYITVVHRLLLVRLFALSAIGLFVAVIFIFYKAPDLAMTQIMVEVTLLIVLLLLLGKFPQAVQKELGPAPIIPGARVVIALTGGLVMGLLAYSGFHGISKDEPTFPGEPTTAQFYLDNADYPPFASREEAIAAGYPGADLFRSGGGTNVVNVILVDFRGADTLGEATVLGIAGLGVLCLLMLGRTPPPPGRRKDTDGTARLAEDDPKSPKPGNVLGRSLGTTPSMILQESGRLSPVLMMLFAIILFFTGHNTPGGGFIAGLMASVAIVTIFLCYKSKDVFPAHMFNYGLLIPLGVIIATGTGIVPMFFDIPFLTSAFTYITIPLLGEFELSSAVAFDLGIFLLVVGTTMLIIERVGRES
ncbi:MAG: DUF4040 domain-containing protein [Candidatus Sumerlaeia bacterium]|nr:DUF4040 domain-containing protein [Candidatus Sumerlaeia bacterium]